MVKGWYKMVFFSKSAVLFKAIRTVSCMAVCVVPSLAAASPYQFEASANFGKAKVKISSSFLVQTINATSEAKGAELTYYMQPVEATAVPLRERAFVGKASFLTGSFVQTDSDDFETGDTFSLGGQAVTAADLIYQLAYTSQDDGTDIDPKTETYEVGIGRYTDDRTTTILTLSHADPVNIISANYRTLNDSATSGTYSALEVGFGFIKADRDSGMQITAGYTYYPSNQLGVGIGFLLSNVEDLDTKALVFNAEYFLSTKMFASANYTKSDIDGAVDLDAYTLELGMRF